MLLNGSTPLSVIELSFGKYPPRSLPDGARVSATDGVTVEFDHGRHILARTGQPNLVSLPRFLHRHGTLFDLEGAFFPKHVQQHQASDTGQDLIVQRRRSNDAVLDNECVRCTAFCNLAGHVIQQRFISALGLTFLEMNDVTQQCRRLDVAATPALVLGTGDFQRLDFRRDREFRREPEHCRGYAHRVSMMAFGIGAATNLQVNGQVAGTVLVDELAADVSEATLRNPRGVLEKLCERIGIPFDEAMLSWTAGARREDG